MFEKDERAIAYERRKRDKRRLTYERRRWRDTRERRRRIMVLKVVCFLCLIGGIYIIKDPIIAQVQRMMPDTSGAGAAPTNGSELEVVPVTKKPDKKRPATVLDVLLKDYPEVEKIIERIDEYPEDMIELLLRNQETIPYALDYLDKYPITEVGNKIDISSMYIEGQIPLFLQWDKQWGYYKYSGKAMAFTGCGPVALSMAVVGLTGDTTMDPLAISTFAANNGYASEGYGSSWTLISEGAEQLGLKVDELILSEKVIKRKLEEGKLIITVMGPGTFTTRGHFIVLTGIDENGKILVNDPNSKKNSRTAWDIDVFMKETKNLWSLEAMQ